MTQAKVLPFTPSESELSALIRRGAELKSRISVMTDELRDINLRLQSGAVFPEGKNTAHLTGGGYTATVQRKMNVKWDQARLAEARARMGDARFFDVFTWEFKPTSAKKLDGFLDFAPEEERALVQAARTLSPGAPQVSYKLLEQRGRVMPLCKITPQATNRFCCLVIGQAGTGKTSLLRTIMGQEYDQESREWKQSREPTEKVLTLSAESGLLCVRDLVEQGMVEGYEIGSLQDFREAQAMLMTPEFRERYGWIFIDSLTEISSRCVEAMRMKHQSGSDTFKMWGEYNDAMTLLIKAFRDMRDYNVVFTCLESADTDDNRRRFLAPAISGSQLKERLTSYFDEVFHMTETASEDGSVWRVFHTAHPVGLAKDRSGRLSPVEPPNLLHIKNKILA